MIDFIKIIIKDLPPAILEANPLLDFYDTVNLTTGELKTINRHGNKVTPSKNATYNGLVFKIYETGTVLLSGSLHKYLNSGAHNFNDFNNEAVLGVLKDLKTKFGINPKECILQCLEIGVNIVPPIPTNEILDNCFLHKTKPFEYQKNSDEGKYKQVQHSQYIIKVYNKALHYKSKGFKIDGEILRFEIKYIKMQKLNEKGIFSLQDLLDYGLNNFKDELVSEWRNVLFFEKSTQIDSLTPKSRNTFEKNYSNPVYWQDLAKENPNNFKKRRQSYEKTTSQYSQNIKQKVSEIIRKKVDLLNIKSTRIDTLIILSNRVFSDSQNENEKRTCRVTGINIEMQKKESVLLSHTGLKYYWKTDKKIFEQLKRKYLSIKWHKSDLETQIKEIAHNIRNADSNQRIKQKKMYQPQQFNLFTEHK